MNHESHKTDASEIYCRSCGRDGEKVDLEGREVCEECEGILAARDAEDDEPPCVDDEVGYDPYLGAYSDDC